MFGRLIMAKKLNSKEQEIKSAIMDRIEDAVDDYFSEFRAKSSDGQGLPSINDIEDLLLQLKSKTRDIYLDMALQSISKFDESGIIESKKANTKKEG